MTKSKDKGTQSEKGKQPVKTSMHAIQKLKIQQTLHWVASEPSPSRSTPSTMEDEEMHDAVKQQLSLEGNRIVLSHTNY